MESQIIERNMEKFNGVDRGSFDDLISQESVGGNAGTWGGLSCLAANFYCDPKNGMIICFGNYQDVPKSIRNRFKEGTLKITVDLKDRRNRIVEVVTYNITDRARQNLEETAKAFNKKKGVKSQSRDIVIALGKEAETSKVSEVGEQCIYESTNWGLSRLVEDKTKDMTPKEREVAAENLKAFLEKKFPEVYQSFGHKITPDNVKDIYSVLKDAKIDEVKDTSIGKESMWYNAIRRGAGYTPEELVESEKFHDELAGIEDISIE